MHLVHGVAAVEDQAACMLLPHPTWNLEDNVCMMLTQRAPDLSFPHVVNVIVDGAVLVVSQRKRPWQGIQCRVQHLLAAKH